NRQAARQYVKEETVPAQDEKLEKFDRADDNESQAKGPPPMGPFSPAPGVQAGKQHPHRREQKKIRQFPEGKSGGPRPRYKESDLKAALPELSRKPSRLNAQIQRQQLH